MPNKEDILRNETHKEEGLETERRVYYTLNDGKKSDLQAHRNSKAIALLIKILRENDVLNEADIDEILIECIR
jgi:hypothetical protein